MVDRRLLLSTTSSPHVLQRIVTVCGRRHCPVKELHWTTEDDRGCVELVVSGEAAHLSTLVLRLADLVDVIDVMGKPELALALALAGPVARDGAP